MMLTHDNKKSPSLPFLFSYLINYSAKTVNFLFPSTFNNIIWEWDQFLLVNPGLFQGDVLFNNSGPPSLDSVDPIDLDLPEVKLYFL